VAAQGILRTVPPGVAPLRIAVESHGESVTIEIGENGEVTWSLSSDPGADVHLAGSVGPVMASWRERSSPPR